MALFPLLSIGLVFPSHINGFRYLKLVKRPTQGHTYLSQCFGNFHSCVQTKLSGYWDVEVSSIHFLILCFFFASLKNNHFGSRESILVSHKNSQTPKEIVIDILSYYYTIGHKNWNFFQKFCFTCFFTKIYCRFQLWKEFCSFLSFGENILFSDGKHGMLP